MPADAEFTDTFAKPGRLRTVARRAFNDVVFEMDTALRWRLVLQFELPIADLKQRAASSAKRHQTKLAGIRRRPDEVQR